jgi:HAD superfamily hydrolase (TIGR01509 family)
VGPVSSTVPRAIRAVIFDCDGVLVDSERIAAPILAELLTELGLPTTAQDIDRDLKGRSWEHGLDVIRARRGGAAPWPDLRARYRERLFEAFDGQLQPVDGIATVLDALDAAGLPSCVASSGDHERIRHALGSAGLLGHFPDDVIFSVDDVEHGKPAPDLFLHAAAQMRFEPATTAIVEDSLAGVQAGVAAGMTVFGYAADTPADELRTAGATPFAAMGELPDLLAAVRTQTPPDE